jgi:hypothetical protein
MNNRDPDFYQSSGAKSVSLGAKSMKSLRKQQTMKLEADQEDYLDLFGREETRVGIFGKYIGAANYLMQEDLRRDESNLKSKEDNSLRQLDQTRKTYKSKTVNKKSQHNAENRV